MQIDYVNGDNGHCWHHRNIVQTSNPPQLLQVCCFCGGDRKVTSRSYPTSGHGEFLPEEDRYTHESYTIGGEMPCKKARRAPTNMSPLWERARKSPSLRSLQ